MNTPFLDNQIYTNKMGSSLFVSAPAATEPVVNVISEPIPEPVIFSNVIPEIKYVPSIRPQEKTYTVFEDSVYDKMESQQCSKKRIRPIEHELDPHKREKYKQRIRNARKKEKQIGALRKSKYNIESPV
jgi:hypothetical protein